MMSRNQKDDADIIFKGWKNYGTLDYVSCWYKKAAEFIDHTKIRCAFVSTNSITQGEQVAPLWKPLFTNFGIHIDFAYRTFIWDSEAFIKAHVHCVIIGFSQAKNDQQKRLFDNGKEKEVSKINPYLVEGPAVFIESRKSQTKPSLSLKERGCLFFHNL